MVGKLEKVPLREIWKNEAKDFTTWLENNIEALSDRLDLNLSVVEREKSVGNFSADLLAEDEHGNRVIIECQLEKTDHDHLGKLLTYLVNMEAGVAIWISSEARQEHVNTLNWLNEATPDDVSIYLVKIEGVRIEDSPPAPLFTAISKPSEDLRLYGEEKKELAERDKKRLAFWEQLLEKSRKKTNLHANITPQKINWITAGAGKSGLEYNYQIL